MQVKGRMKMKRMVDPIKILNYFFEIYRKHKLHPFSLTTFELGVTEI